MISRGASFENRTARHEQPPTVTRAGKRSAVSCFQMFSKVAEKVKTGAAAMELAKQAPVLMIFALFVIGVFYYQERRDQHWMKMLERDDKVSAMRIEECHRVQGESTQAIRAVASALQNQTLAFKEFSIRLENHANR
jgi:hypothetical protein